MDVDEVNIHGGSEEFDFLDSVEGEIALFRAVTRARPVGIHRHFHVLTIRNSIYADTGRLVPVDDIWAKLRRCYDLEILENIEADGYDVPGESSSPAVPVPSPSPSENLAIHPFFRYEYTLPPDASIDSLISKRRMRATASIPSSSPGPSSSHHDKSAGGARQSKRAKTKLRNMAGLVGGDSDSSALTQESGDESINPTPRESYATGTDGGSQSAEDEDVEMREPSPVPSTTTKTTRKTTKYTRRGSGASRGRGGSTAGARGKRKKK
ncbi:hypothetical protein BKA93DRAFT_825818 [Sparassis latifolia]